MEAQASSDISSLRHSSTRTRRSFVNAILALLVVFFYVALLFISSVGSNSAHATSSMHATTGCDKAPPFPAGASRNMSLTVEGLQRSYRMHLPVGYRSSHQYPLVLSFHGHGGAAMQMESYTGLSKLANQQGFVVAYPQGTVGPDKLTGWSSGGVGKPHVNDVLFASDVISDIQAKLCINPQRIFASGFSNGGGMTGLLACRLANRIAAFASVSGSYYAPAGGCHPTRPASILEIHGTSDTVVPYDGNSALGLIGSEAWTHAWAVRDGCNLNPMSKNLGQDLTSSTWIGCQDGVTVVHFRIIDGTHVWPGSTTLQHAQMGDTDLEADALIWGFFVAHPLSPARNTSA